MKIIDGIHAAAMNVSRERGGKHSVAAWAAVNGVAQMRMFTFALAAALTLATVAESKASIAIDLSLSGMSSSQEAAFSSAQSTWESILTGYQDPMVGTVGISVEAIAIDGIGGVLGGAGPDTAAYGGTFWYTDTGSIVIDVDDLEGLETSGTLLAVALHEMAHVLGFGTLWNPVEDYAVPLPGQAVYSALNAPGEYIGAAALAEYQSEFDPLATYVPVEIGGGGGTAHSHWNEVDGGSALTGFIGPGGDLAYELMTGWLNTPTYISNTTKASFIDIGYVVNLGTVPEPSSFAIWGLMTIGLVGYVWRRRRGWQR